MSPARGVQVQYMTGPNLHMNLRRLVPRHCAKMRIYGELLALYGDLYRDLC